MKYKVGDKVQIKSEEWIYNNVGIPHVLAYLLEYAGKYAKITRVSKSDNPKYRIEIDYGEFEWFDLLFEENTIAETPTLQDISKTIREQNLGVSVKEEEGKLIIEPLKVEHDLPVDTPVMVKMPNDEWKLAYYAGELKTQSGEILKSTWVRGYKSGQGFGSISQTHIIPFDKFDPNNIEESLKHNIVKP